MGLTIVQRYCAACDDRRHESGCNTHAPTASPKCHSLALYPFSSFDTLIETRYSAENAIFIVYVNCLRGVCQHNVTSGRLTA